jgi:hypothetical protein
MWRMRQFSGMTIVLMANDVRRTSDMRRQMHLEHCQLSDHVKVHAAGDPRSGARQTIAPPATVCAPGQRRRPSLT